MLAAVGRLWAWFVGGLTEALLWSGDRLTRRPAHRLEIVADALSLLGPDRKPLGRFIGAGESLRLEPSEVLRRLARSGLDVDIAIPSAWLFRRGLDPVAVASAPFLDAFVRHHIERVTPWRVADVVYRILKTPLAGDPSRLAIEVAVVPKRLLRQAFEAVALLQPKRLRLVAEGGAGEAPLVIPLGQDKAGQDAGLRRRVAGGLIALMLACGGALGWIYWQIDAVSAEIESDDSLVAERKALLAAAARHVAPGTDADAVLRTLRLARPRVVDVIEALSAALPDSAYLTGLVIDKDQLTLSGISTDTAHLVPPLETSGRFADVAFSAATTRLETGPGDRFHLAMRAKAPPVEAASPGPPPRRDAAP
jgi:general secretion pathway protein L